MKKVCFFCNSSSVVVGIPVLKGYGLCKLHRKHEHIEKIRDVIRIKKSV